MSKITKKQVLDNIADVKKYIEELEGAKEEPVKKLEIKNRFTGDAIWSSTKTIYKEAVEEAIGSNANLSYANLSDADLRNANLSDANLRNANLSYANLSDADLRNANLTGCLFYMGNGNRNFEALCKAIKTINHRDGKFEDLIK